MQSVSQNSQFRARAVVARSRPCALLTLLLASTSSARSAAAADDASATEPRPATEQSPPIAQPFAAELPPEDPVPPARHSYAGLLTATYIVAPFLALGVGGSISTLTQRDEISVGGGCLMSLLPASVHVAHGNGGQGLASFAELVGITLGGVVLGGLVGGVIATETCSSDVSDGCDFAAWGGIVYGTLIGGVVGYVGFAIYDVSANAFYVTEAPAQSAATLQLWLTPVPAARAEHATAASLWSGVQLGLTLHM